MFLPRAEGFKNAYIGELSDGCSVGCAILLDPHNGKDPPSVTKQDNGPHRRWRLQHFHPPASSIPSHGHCLVSNQKTVIREIKARLSRWSSMELSLAHDMASERLSCTRSWCGLPSTDGVSGGRNPQLCKYGVYQADSWECDLTKRSLPVTKLHGIFEDLGFTLDAGGDGGRLYGNRKSFSFHSTIEIHLPLIYA